MPPVANSGKKPVCWAEQGFGCWEDAIGRFGKTGQLHDLHRTYFHLPLEETLPETWTHFEATPSGGRPPILFRFFWIDIALAQARPTLGSGEMLSIDCCR